MFGSPTHTASLRGTSRAGARLVLSLTALTLASSAQAHGPDECPPAQLVPLGPPVQHADRFAASTSGDDVRYLAVYQKEQRTQVVLNETGSVLERAVSPISEAPGFVIGFPDGFLARSGSDWILLDRQGTLAWKKQTALAFEPLSGAFDGVDFVIVGTGPDPQTSGWDGGGGGPNAAEPVQLWFLRLSKSGAVLAEGKIGEPTAVIRPVVTTDASTTWVLWSKGGGGIRGLRLGKAGALDAAPLELGAGFVAAAAARAGVLAVYSENFADPTSAVTLVNGVTPGPTRPLPFVVPSLPHKRFAFARESDFLLTGELVGAQGALDQAAIAVPRSGSPIGDPFVIAVGEEAVAAGGGTDVLMLTLKNAKNGAKSERLLVATRVTANGETISPAAAIDKSVAEVQDFCNEDSSGCRAAQHSPAGSHAWLVPTAALLLVARARGRRPRAPAQRPYFRRSAPRE